MLDVIDPLETLHQRAPVAFGRRRGSDRPGHDVDVLLLDQGLEPGHILVAPAFGLSVEEAADQQVRLARAAMPGAEAKALEAGVAVHRLHAELAALGNPAGCVTSPC